MRLLYLLTMCLLASCSGACVTTPPKPPVYIDYLTEGQYRATARLIVTCEDGRTVLGSGVAISSTDMITAKHVLVGCPIAEITAVTLDGELDVQVQSVSISADAARLRVTAGKFERWAHTYLGPVPIGAKVCSVGGDGRVQLMRKCGEVFFSNKDITITSIQAVPGNSGGPVFYGAYVVGLVSMGSWHPNHEKVQLYVPVGAFYDILGVQ